MNKLFQLIVILFCCCVLPVLVLSSEITTTSTTSMKLPKSSSTKSKKKRVSTTKDEINVSKMTTECMRKDAHRPLVRVIEHGLPEALQTHEMVVDHKSRSILATQMMEGRLLKLNYDKNGEISSKGTFSFLCFSKSSIL